MFTPVTSHMKYGILYTGPRTLWIRVRVYINIHDNSLAPICSKGVRRLRKRWSSVDVLRKIREITCSHGLHATPETATAAPLEKLCTPGTGCGG